MDKTFEVTLWDENHTLTIPDLPPDAILPGAYRGDMLALFNMFLGKYPLKTMEEVSADREAHKDHWWAWAEANYTWNHLLREGPHLGIQTTTELVKMMFDRDLNSELAGGLLDTGKAPDWMAIFGMTTKEQYFATLIITAARYAWWNRVQNNGLPDPKVDPLPPIHHHDRVTISEIYRQHIKPFIDQHLTSKGYNRELPVMTALILYVMGYLADRPAWVDIPEDLWQETLHGFIKPPYAPFLWMLHSPGEYLNAIAEEGHEGKHNGFFSTPTNVTRFMSEILGATTGHAFANGHYALADGLWQCNVPGNTPEERRKMLVQSVSDPCVGAGNMLWGFINQFVYGEFVDINPALVHATRALCAMHAPWFFHSTLRANSLALVPSMKEEWENARQYLRDGILEQIRAESTLAYYIAERAGAALPADWMPQALHHTWLGQERLFAHLEARANARLAEKRNAYNQSVFGDRLHALNALLEGGAQAESAFMLPQDEADETQPATAEEQTAPLPFPPQSTGAQQAAQLSFFD